MSFVPLFVLAALPLSSPISSPISSPGSPPVLSPTVERPTDLGEVRAGELLVKLQDRVTGAREAAATVLRLARRTGLALEYQRPTLAGWHLLVLRGADTAETVAAALRLADEPEVTAVVPNANRSMLRAPDDPLFDALWGLSLIEAEAAWDLSVGERGQRIGVVDSGTTSAHRDLRGRVARGWDFISDARVAEDGDGRDDDDRDDSPRATHFHGTHVAGTILARANDGFGIAGLNWRAGLVSARVLGRGGRGSLVDIVEGAAWMAGIPVDDAPPIGADQVSVINLSLGGRGGCTSFERDVYDEILARGVVLVAAAGNAGNGTPVGAPASCPGVVAVGAVGPDLTLASFSSFSSRIDVMAPGGDDTGDVADLILSIDGGDLEGHRWMAGTSMAAPHVTGVVSLMQAVAPDLDPAMIRDVLLDSPWTCEGCDDEALLQADHAVQTAMERQQELAGSGAGGDAPSELDVATEPTTRLASESPASPKGGCEATPGAAGLVPLLGVWRRRRSRYSRISVTTPEPTVRPPSRMAKRS